MNTEWFDGHLYMALERHGNWMRVEDLIKATVDIEVRHVMYTWWGEFISTMFGHRCLRWFVTPSYSKVEQAIGLHVLRGNIIVRDIEGLTEVVMDPKEVHMARVELKVKHTLEESMDIIGRYHSPQGRRSRFGIVPGRT
jgi:hypothetical protein